jgi:hypothetical protein
VTFLIPHSLSINSLLDCLAWLRGQCPTPSPIRILFFLFLCAAAAHRPRPSRLLFHHQAPVYSPPGLSDSILSLSRSPPVTPPAVTSPDSGSSSSGPGNSSIAVLLSFPYRFTVQYLLTPSAVLLRPVIDSSGKGPSFFFFHPSTHPSILMSDSSFLD